LSQLNFIRFAIHTHSHTHTHAHTHRQHTYREKKDILPVSKRESRDIDNNIPGGGIFSSSLMMLGWAANQWTRQACQACQAFGLRPRFRVGCWEGVWGGNLLSGWVYLGSKWKFDLEFRALYMRNGENMMRMLMTTSKSKMGMW